MATGRVPTTANSPLTAKGDLFTYSTAPARLAVGLDGEQIVADSSTSTGLRYQGNFAAGKNKIINGDFSINQRGITSTGSTYGASGTDAYTLDRWVLNYSSGTVTTSVQQFTLGTAPVSGYESKQYLRSAVSGQTENGSAYSLIAQKIENVRTFAGQTATFSFWAKAASGTPKVAIAVQQMFGTGGSPSSPAITNAGTVTLSTSWARYSVTLAVPTISGYTLGTNENSSALSLWFLTSCTTSYGFGQSIGIQNNTFDFWGVQAEQGSVATAFNTATGTIQGELAACQRYYWRSTGGAAYSVFGGNCSAWSTVDLLGGFNLPVTMRTNPTSVEYSSLIASDGVNNNSVGTLTFSSAYSSPNVGGFSATSTGLTAFRFYRIQANNSTSAYIAYSAEL